MRLLAPAVLALLLAAPALSAQAPNVPGFAGIRWGAPKDSVVARLGAPANEQTDRGNTVLYFRGKAYGHDAMAVVFLRGAEGLVAGFWSVDVPGQGDCRPLMASVAAGVRADVGGAAPTEEQRDPAHEADPCAAIRAKEWYGRTTWTDAGGHRATLSADDRRLVAMFER